MISQSFEYIYLQLGIHKGAVGLHINLKQNLNRVNKQIN